MPVYSDTPDRPINSERSRGQGDLVQALEQQTKLLEVVTQSINDLQQRLELVLRPEGPSPDASVNVRDVGEAHSPLLDQVHTTNRRLEGYVMRLREISDRLE